MSDTYYELERQLLEEKITPEEFVEKYKEMMEPEWERHREPLEPHEHI